MGHGTANTNFIVHTKFNLIVTGIIVIILYLKVLINCNDIILVWDYIVNTRWIQNLVIGIIFESIWLNPDIDSNKSRTYKNWLLLRGYWYFYTKKMAHKGNSYNLFGLLDVKRGIGHNEFIGTALRLTLASPLLLLNFSFEISLHSWLNIIAGIWIGDCLHILVDLLYHKN